MPKLRLRFGFVLTFDVVSFLAGVAAGIITGGLAGLLHSLERTADLQENVRRLSQEVERICNRATPTELRPDAPDVEGLQKDLDEIHAEIRKMYKRSTR